MADTGSAASGATLVTTSGAGVADGAANFTDGCEAGWAGGVKYWTGAPAPWS